MTFVPDSGVVEEPAPDPVAQAAARRPEAVALIAGDTVLTWADLDAKVTAAAHFLAARTAPGDRVGSVLGNTVDFVVTWFGTLRAGRVAVPINPAYTADEAGYAITDARCALIVIGHEDELRLGLGASCVRPEFDPAGPVDLPRVAANDLAVLLYTSGTSGRPKAAMLTHAALAANHEQLDRIEPAVVGPDDVVLLCVPFFHAYGLNTGLGSVVHHAATGVLAERFDPAATLELIAARGVTVVVGVPGMYQAWARQAGAGEALRGVRTAVCGAAPLDRATAARFRATTGKTILIGYGLTECAPVLTTTAVSHPEKTGSIGRPLPGVELSLRTGNGVELWRDGTASPEEDLAELDLAVAVSAGTDPGEIVVRGPNLFAGYWPDAAGGPDADGWWATGDIAYADGDGDLVLVDRIGELILVNGFNVYPAEIERVLDAHPRVVESAVVGRPDPEAGQRPHAYVVVAGDPPPSVTELQVHCAARLARFKLPTIELVGSLPRSVSGKIRKRELS
ncbi:AMP-binding protein [Actinoplanes oblitus]|uniref:AMP-binding protein n=1 Tax=Actinoplanes oblitus TaxID=3040509 RepID=A0ABY8WF79_9ACTN|nr:AMP-binding protein [Actinoplanes oblitus]WIM96047.1 AMP-binding protein [Actinoplanes oblitus]